MPDPDFSAFGGSTERFSVYDAYCLAQVSKAAYDEPRVAQGKFVAWRFGWDGFDLRPLTGPPDTEAYLVRNRTMAIVAFRGSESPRAPGGILDWFSDADIKPVTMQGWGAVHCGFATALDGVWDQLVARLSNFVGERQLWLTGHSLGAAIAALASAKLEDSAHRITGLYTFGQPRTGLEKFAERFNAKIAPRTFRVVNDDDIVCRLPPRFGDFVRLADIPVVADFGRLLRRGLAPDIPQYDHVERARWFGASGRVRQVQPRLSAEPLQYFDGIRHVLPHLVAVLRGEPTERKDLLRKWLADLPDGFVQDHFIDNYIAGLRHRLK